MEKHWFQEHICIHTVTVETWKASFKRKKKKTKTNEILSPQNFNLDCDEE